MANRIKLVANLDVGGRRGYEIGALSSPIVSKGGLTEIVYVDRWDTQTLRDRYAADNIDPATIVDVDVVLGERALHEALAPHAPFDYAIASHVMEHVPDLVGWLADVESTVRPGGDLLLVLPDKRYTFDYLRQETRLAEVIEAWAQGFDKPSVAQVFDYNANAADIDTKAAWAGTIDPAQVKRYVDLSWALTTSLEALDHDRYEDSHCWVFTPDRFFSIMADLAVLGLTRWRPRLFYPTARDDMDFACILQRAAPEEEQMDIAAAHRALVVQRAKPAEVAGEGAPMSRDEARMILAELKQLRADVTALRRAPSKGWFGRLSGSDKPSDR